MFPVIAMYKTRRRTTSGHQPVKPLVLGIGSKINEKHHLLFMDVDNKKVDIFQLLAQLLRTVEKMTGEIVDYIVSRTSKGYHIILLYPFTWRQVLHIWNKYKFCLDRKWINLQRKRQFAILRVSPKYNRGDIHILFVRVTKPWTAYLFRIYSALVRGAHGGKDIQGQGLCLCENKQETLFNVEDIARSSEERDRAGNSDSATGGMGDRRVREKSCQRSEVVNRVILPQDNGDKISDMEDEEADTVVRGAITTSGIRGGGNWLSIAEGFDLRVEEGDIRVYEKG